MENRDLIAIIISILLVFALLSVFSGGYGMMSGYGYGMMSGFSSFFIIGWMICILLVIFLVLGIIWLLSQLENTHRNKRRRE